jgi:hypothetical protein
MTFRTETSELDRERDAAMERKRRRNLDEYFPAWLLHEAPAGAAREALRTVAEERWPTMDLVELDHVVDRALTIREERRGERIDPAAVEGLRHPREREKKTMATKLSDDARARLTEWTKERVAEHEDPKAEGVGAEMHREAMAELGIDLAYATFRYTYFMPALEALPTAATNGAKPEGAAPDEPPAVTPEELAGEETDAEVEALPAVEFGETIQGERVVWLSPAAPDPETPIPDIRIERSRTAGRMDVHLSLRGVPVDVALRVGAAVADAVNNHLDAVA